LWIVPWPFLTAPLSIGLFFITEADLAPLIFDEPLQNLTIAERAWTSVSFGTLFLTGNWAISKFTSSKQDFAFWGYIFGLLAFWGGLTDLYFEVYENDWQYKLAYGGINVVLLLLAVGLQRSVFLVFGGLGVSTDIIDFLLTESTVEINSWISVAFGSILIGAAYVIQNKDPSQDFPFWGYLSGVAIFWGGWTTLFAWPIYGNYYFDFLYFVVNVGLLSASIYTKQRVFLFFGSVGVLWYIEWLVNTVLWNSWYLPLVLTLLGLAFIAIAIYYSGGGTKKPAASQPDPIDIEKSKNVYSINEGNITYPVVFGMPMMGLPASQIVPYPVAQQDD